MPDVVDEGARDAEPQHRDADRVDRWTSGSTWPARAGSSKHGAIVAWLKAEHGMGHGNANLVALTALRGAAAPRGRRPDRRRSTPVRRPTLRRCTMRPWRWPAGSAMTWSSPRSRRMWRCDARSSSGRSGRRRAGGSRSGSTSRTSSRGRLEATTGMCTHRVRLVRPDELDAEVRGWLREAYDRA